MVLTETREKILEYANKKKISISEKDVHGIPYIVQARPLFDYDGTDPAILKALGLSADDLFASEGLFNTAVFPDGRVEGLRIMSDQYQVVQHDETLLYILEHMPDDIGIESVDLHISGNGGRFNAHLKTKIYTEIVKGDKIFFRVSVDNSADGTHLLKLRHGAWRQWCSNGASMPDKRFKREFIRRLHKTNLDIDETFANFIQTMESVPAALDGWKRYAKKSLKAPDLEGLFEELEVGPRVQTELMETTLRGDEVTPQLLLENKNLTAWNMFNAFTQRITDSTSEESVKVANNIQVSRTFERLVA